MRRTSPDRPRGRPKARDAPLSLDEMLAAALRAFATHGYDGVSVTALGRDLGVSHNLLHQRFGSKEALWYAAVDWGFGGLARELASTADPTLTDPLEQLRLMLRRFLEISAARPELLGLMNIEGRQETERLEHLWEHHVGPMTTPLRALLDHLAAQGRIRPVSLRTVHFLLTHGGAAPFTLVPLARRLDPAEPLAPDEVDGYAAAVADVLVAGLQAGAAAPDPA